MRARITFLLVFLFCTLVVASASADVRVALVIGNSGYQNVARLVNPSNDASAVTEMFRKARFDVVELRQDLNNVEMRRTLREFAVKSRDADMAVVYYAGHGIEVDGMNYLVPVDAVLDRDTDAYDEAIGLDRVLQVIEPARRLRLVILDACRDNPFARTMKRTVVSRALGRGLIGVEPGKPNTLIAFAAKGGSTADDGAGANSPFTTALLKHLTTPGQDLRKAFGLIRDDVMKATGDRQEPFVYGSLGGADVSLVPAPEVPKATLPGVNSLTDVRHDYELAERIGTKESWETFLKQYPSGFYSGLASAQIRKLQIEEARRVSPEQAKAVEPEGARPPPERVAPPVATASVNPTSNRDSGGSPVDLTTLSTEPLRDPQLLREVRARLYELNFDPGPIEGPFGAQARAAIREFEATNKLASTGQPTAALLRRLRDVPELKPWGSLAYAKGSDKWGMAWGKSSRREAVDSARASCGDSQKCGVQLSFYGSECAAFAHSRTSWAIVARDDVRTAKEAALSDCKKKGVACTLVAAVCADGSNRTLSDQ
jgi:hypothetical protein